MESDNQWDWFYSLVIEIVEPELKYLGFVREQFVGFKGDERWKIHGGIAYKSNTEERIFLDIIDRIEKGIYGDVFWVRAQVSSLPETMLKLFLYPQIREEKKAVELWHGWICHSKQDIIEALKEIAIGFRTFFNQKPGNNNPD